MKKVILNIIISRFHVEKYYDKDYSGENKSTRNIKVCFISLAVFKYVWKAKGLFEVHRCYYWALLTASLIESIF